MKIIVKQPNGQHALVNLKDGFFIMNNATVEQIRERCVAKATAQIDSDIIGFFHNRSQSIAGHDDPYFKHAVRLQLGACAIHEDVLDDLREM